MSGSSPSIASERFSRLIRAACTATVPSALGPSGPPFPPDAYIADIRRSLSAIRGDYRPPLLRRVYRRFASWLSTRFSS